MSRKSGWLKIIAIGWLATWSCSSKPSEPEPPGNSGVSLETSRRETGTIGAAGGSVATTSSGGVTYTLEILPNALPGDVEIAITPVTSIGNLPFTGRLEGAVQLEPSGLVLLKPAVLTIAKAPSTSPTERLLGFAYEGNAASFEATAAFDGTTEIRVLVSHFSGAGAASAGQSSADPFIAQFCTGIPKLEGAFNAQLELCEDPSMTRPDWLVSFGRDYLDQIVIPLVQSGDSFWTGIAKYIEWYQGCASYADFHNLPNWENALASEIATLQDLVKTELVAAVAAEKSALCSQGNPEHLRRIFEYYQLVGAAELEDVIGLRTADILEGLCAEIRIPEIMLADPMPMNQGTSLDARAELWINNQREGGLFKFTVNTNGTNVTCGTGEATCSGNSNGFGEYTGVVTRTGPGLVTIDLFASLMLEVRNLQTSIWVESPLIGAKSVERESYSIAATFPSEVEPGQPVTLTAVVTRNNDVGNPQPIEGAMVTFAADGGSANPTQGTTDATGSFSTQVTANDGPNRVVVDIAAWVNGIQVASRTVEAAIDHNPNPAAFALLRRTSDLNGIEVHEGCSGSEDLAKHAEGAGPFTLAVQGNVSCTFDDEQGTVFTQSQSVLSEQFSDVRPDSGLIRIETNGTLSADITCGGPNCEGQSSMVSHLGVVWIEFRITEAVNFEFDGTHSESYFNTIPPNFTVTRIDSGLDEKMNWNGYNTTSWDGTLEPGDYRVHYHAHGVVTSGWGDPFPMDSTSWDTELTLKLTRVPAAPLAGGR